jgi:TatA/E family protein of Tat protein translocase
MFGSVGLPELIMIFIVVLFLFGPDKLPDFAKTLGKTIREFRRTVNDAKSAIEEEISKIDTSQEFKESLKELNINIKDDLREIDLNLKDELKEVDRDIQKITRMDTEDDRQQH